MIDYFLVFLLGMYIGSKLDRWMLLTMAHHMIARDEAKACPHGYTNWDDCPDCCH